MYLAASALQEIDYELVKKVAILELFAEEKWLTATEIARRLQMDTRSVGRIRHELMKEYQRFTGSDLPLFIRDKQGYQMVIAENELEQEQFLIHLIRHTLSIQMLEEMIGETVDSLHGFSNAFFISETTAHRKLSEIKGRLARSGIQLRRGSYQLAGDEMNVRMYLSIYYWRLFRGKIWPFRQIDQQIVSQIADATMAFFDVDFHEMKKRRLEYLIAASLLRESQHHKITEATVAPYLKQNDLFDSFSREITPILPAYHQTETAVGYLYLALLTREEYYQQADKMTAIKKNYQQQEILFYQHYQQITRQLIENLQTEDRPQGKQLLDQAQGYLLSGHLFVELFPKLERGINADSFWRPSLQRPMLHQWLKKHFDEIREKTGEESFSEHSLLFHRYMTILKELPEFSPHLPCIRILLLTDLPLFEEDVLIKDLTHFFKRNYRLLFLRKPSEASYDLCLTTSYLLWPLASGIPTVLITEELKMEDYIQLMEVFETTVNQTEAEKSKESLKGKSSLRQNGFI